MTDPILYLSMILGLTGVYVLISSFGDDDDDSNDDGERYIYNLEYVKVGKQLGSINKIIDSITKYYFIKINQT